KDIKIDRKIPRDTQ
ncbi:hypothetical protein CP8484711_0617B, partial [Chlamydia psittaci 84-8471/1]